MKILALDFGEARTGVAICDEKEIISYPLETIVEKDNVKLIEKISDIVVLKKAKMILVGLPLNMDGSEGEKAAVCRNFAEKLKIKTNLPVALWDERQTTKQALKYLINMNVKKNKKKNIVDTISATIILESFLQYRKNNSKINLI